MATTRTTTTKSQPKSIAVEPKLEATDYPDSAYGDEILSFTTSLSPSITDYKFENNRRYHAYKEGSASGLSSFETVPSTLLT